MSEVAQNNPTQVSVAAMDNANTATGGGGEEEPLFYGRWKAEEERYAEMVIQEFRAGNLDIEEGTTLRGYLANVLNCAPKRISKKFESSGYNGRQQYIRKPANFTPEEAKKRIADLQVARQEFETRRKGLVKKTKRGGSIKTASPKTTAFLKKRATANAAAENTPVNAEGAMAALPPQFSHLVGQGLAPGGAHGLSYLMGASSRTGLPSSGLDPLQGVMYPGRMNYADLLLARNNPGLGLSPSSLGSSSFFPSRAGFSGSSSDSALMAAMLRGPTGPSLGGFSASGGYSRDMLGAELMQRRLDAAQMARREFEQRYLMEQINGEQRKRMLERTTAEGAAGIMDSEAPAAKRARQEDK